MAMCFFALCWSGFPLFVILFPFFSRFGLVCVIFPFSFFFLGSVWFVRVKEGWRLGEGFCCRGSINLRRRRYLVMINHSFICFQFVVYLLCFNILICCRWNLKCQISHWMQKATYTCVECRRPHIHAHESADGEGFVQHCLSYICFYSPTWLAFLIIFFIL